jgi:hypothetical protein
VLLVLHLLGGRERAKEEKRERERAREVKEEKAAAKRAKKANAPGYCEHAGAK